MSTTARGLEALGVGQRIAQDQPAFGVGVEDISMVWPLMLVTTSPGLTAVAVGHVLAGGDQADHIDLPVAVRPAP